MAAKTSSKSYMLNNQGGANITVSKERTDTLTAATNSSGNNRPVVVIVKGAK